MPGMLEGVRVLDLTQMLAGPFGSLVLADLGAEVIKVEPPAGDETREMPPYFYGEDSAYFWSFNRDKKSVVLNLKNPEGLKVFYELVAQADVVYDNYRPGVTERLKIDYPNLQKINPQIICCSVSSFGYTGPYRNRPGYDLIVQAMSGGMSITGEPGRPPVRAGIPIGDLMGGTLAAHGILAAYIARLKTGKGRWIEVSLLDGQIYLLTYIAQYYIHSGKVPGPIGSSHASAVLYDSLQTQDIRIVVVAHQNHHFELFCKAIGKPEWAKDPRFATRASRLENKATLIPLIESVLKTRSGDEWLEKIHAVGVPAGPINTVDRVLKDPQVLAREMVIEVAGRSGEKVKGIGSPFKIHDLPKEESTSPPRLGEHTRAILSNLLHYSSEKIDRLAKEGVVKTLGKVSMD